MRPIKQNDPGYANLPEADQADMEFFLEQIQTLLPVLGYEFLREQPKPQPLTSELLVNHPPQSTSPIFLCEVRRHGISARAQEVDGEFVVFKGSTTRSDWEGVENTYTSLFNELVYTGVLAKSSDGKLREFTRDYAFSSPSAAAAVVSGRSANGRVQWLTEFGSQTYGAWQEDRVNQALGDPTLADRLLGHAEAITELA